jgi:hypothetical protein
MKRTLTSFSRTLALKSRRRRGFRRLLTKKVKKIKLQSIQIMRSLASKSREMRMQICSKVRQVIQLLVNASLLLHLVGEFKSPLM